MMGRLRRECAWILVHHPGDSYTVANLLDGEIGMTAQFRPKFGDEQGEQVEVRGTSIDDCLRKIRKQVPS